MIPAVSLPLYIPISPAATPLRLGKPELDTMIVREPDLALYDAFCVRSTKDPGDPDDGVQS